MTALIYSDAYLRHETGTHIENKNRLVAIVSALKRYGLWDMATVVEPMPAGDEALRAVHTPAMIDRVKSMGASGGGWLDPDTFVSPASYEAAALAAGGVLEGCRRALEGIDDTAFALVRPPGHHATGTTSMGFCLFNNIAVAAQAVAEQGKKVLIYDHDVHHGNGTQDIFYASNRVLYMSTHLSPFYPGTGAANEIGTGDGAGYTLNVPLTSHTDDSCIDRILNEIFLPVAREFSPDIVLISAGFDAHRYDILGNFSLTSDYFGTIIRRFRDICPRLICTLEGGYEPRALGEGVASEVATMLDQPLVFDTPGERETPRNDAARSADFAIAELKKHAAEYWAL